MLLLCSDLTPKTIVERKWSGHVKLFKVLYKEDRDTEGRL
jgi:hypothetical protein